MHWHWNHRSVVILIDGSSASASEIVAGALSIHGRAVLIGEQSYGKGSVQTIFPLRENSGLRLTTAMYFLPDGTTIHEKGITPSIVIENDDLNRSKLRIQSHALANLGKESFNRLFGFEPLSDPQLKVARQTLLQSFTEDMVDP